MGCGPGAKRRSPVRAASPQPAPKAAALTTATTTTATTATTATAAATAVTAAAITKDAAVAPDGTTATASTATSVTSEPAARAAVAAPGGVPGAVTAATGGVTPAAPVFKVPDVKFLRGFSGAEDDELADLVSAALEGWAGTNPNKISVKENSGDGPMATHRVSIDVPGIEPAAVALHCWRDVNTIDPIYQQRTSAAGRMFASSGLAPPRLAQGGDWFLEPWEGQGNPEFSLSRMEELGHLVARIHAMESDWFEPFRKMLCDRWPGLDKVPKGSHVWGWTSRGDLLDDCSEEVREIWYGTRWFDPETPAACRIVTVHADLHPGNMLETDAGIRVVDFEYSCVSHAVQDLSFIAAKCCNDDPVQKQAFLESYLRHTGFSATPEDVQALHFDTEIGFLGCHTAPLELWIAHDDAERWKSKVALYKPLIEEARRRPDLRARVLEKGVVGYLDDLSSFCFSACPLSFCSLPHSEHNRLLLNDDGTISPEALSTLVFGLSNTGGLLELVPSSDVRAFHFKLESETAASPDAPALGTAASSAAGNVAGAAAASSSSTSAHASGGENSEGQDDCFRLVLASNSALGLGSRNDMRRLVRGMAIVEIPVMTPAAQAVVLCRSGPFLVHTTCDGRRLSLYCGDVDKDLGKQQAKELYAAAETNDVAKLQALIAKGVDINFPQDYESLGHLVARQGNALVLALLIGAGLDVNADSSYGGSALIEAATYGHLNCVQILLQVPSLDLHKAEDDKTALEWAQDPSPHSELKPSHKQIESLLEAAAKARKK